MSRMTLGLSKLFQVYSPYSLIEVEALIGLYLELKSNHVGVFAQIRLMDFDKNMKLLPLLDRKYIFLYGICNLTSREVAELENINAHKYIIERYNSAKAKLHKYLNGDYEHKLEGYCNRGSEEEQALD